MARYDSKFGKTTCQINCVRRERNPFRIDQDEKGQTNKRPEDESVGMGSKRILEQSNARAEVL